MLAEKEKSGKVILILAIEGKNSSKKARPDCISVFF
jgi:hypothetical protein